MSATTPVRTTVCTISVRIATATVIAGAVCPLAVPAALAQSHSGLRTFSATSTFAEAEEEFVIYVDPNASQLLGEPEPNGLSPDRAVPSFEAAQEILIDKKATNVRVLTRGGVYYLDKEILWTYDPPGGHITFEAEPNTGEVVFNGSRMQSLGVDEPADADAVAAGIVEAEPKKGYCLTVTASQSGTTISGKTFEYCSVGGIYINGSSARANNIVIKNNLIRYLGNKHVASFGDMGFGGVHLKYGTGAKITNNKFYYLENTTASGNIHGVYMSLSTHSTMISENRFGYISGDPIRTRDNSTKNIVDGNLFWRAGTYATFSDWRYGEEKCGRGNVFQNNKYGKSYYGRIFGSGGQGGVKRIKLLLWGRDSPKDANLGGCSPSPISNNGGNQYVTNQPW